MRSRKSMLAALAALTMLGGGGGAHAQTAPVNIRLAWVAPLSNWASIWMEKKDLAKHLGKSYTLETIRFAGTPPMVTAMANNAVDIGNLAYSTLRPLRTDGLGPKVRPFSDRVSLGFLPAPLPDAAPVSELSVLGPRAEDDRLLRDAYRSRLRARYAFEQIMASDHAYQVALVHDRDPVDVVRHHHTGDLRDGSVGCRHDGRGGHKALDPARLAWKPGNRLGRTRVARSPERQTNQRAPECVREVSLGNHADDAIIGVDHG